MVKMYWGGIASRIIHDAPGRGVRRRTREENSVSDRRVQFDFEVDFSNGGGIQGQGFRLDIEEDDIADAALAEYIVRDMRLLMVGAVRIRNKTILREAHKRPGAPAAPARLVDLSHTVEDGMVTYRGLPAPVIGDHWTREESRRHFAPGTEFHIGRIEMVANTGTYVDSPFHRYPDGRDLADLRLESLADLPGVVVRAAGRAERGIDVAALQALDVRGKAVLLHTGWDAHWRTGRYFDGHPFLTAAGAEWLAGHGAALVGIDSLNIDDTADLRRSAHTTLLGRDIPVVEHLSGLAGLPDSSFRFFAVPVKVRGLGTFPVRAFAVI
jgi:kynurenine formamidase